VSEVKIIFQLMNLMDNWSFCLVFLCSYNIFSVFPLYSRFRFAINVDNFPNVHIKVLPSISFFW